MVQNMNRITDKLIIFIFSLTLYLYYIGTNELYVIVPILVIIIISALLSYYENIKINLFITLTYFTICFYNPTFIFFIPIISYDVPISKYKWCSIIPFLPLMYNNSPLIAVAIIIVYLIKYRTFSLENTKVMYFELRDNTVETSMILENKNKELLEKQDYEINLATLKERNRIARDIHDNVGHMLSRSILQIGALLTITKEIQISDSLSSIKDTLCVAMDSIRNSVHDLHEKSIDLQEEIKSLINNFKFCAVEFYYDIESSMEKNQKYSFISITKEALSNIIKHSNATNVSIIMREHPSIYQLIIQDNGLNSIYNFDKGIGLKNIGDRVSALGGYLNINCDKGFKIFISIPK